MLITNYITSAWRNILRHKMFSIINILGLAIGLAAVMLIALYVRYETSYDSFWKNADNIYRLHIKIDSRVRAPFYGVSTSGRYMGHMVAQLEEIGEFTRILHRTRSVTLQDRFYQDDISVVDPSFINIFDFDVLRGDLETIRQSNNALVLNETLASKYFGNENPIGQTVTIDLERFQRDYLVVAVVRDVPKNTKLPIKAFVPFTDEDWQGSGTFEAWYGMYIHSYFTLKDRATIDDLNAQLPSFVERNFPRLPVPDELAMSEVVTLSPMNIKDLHLNAIGATEFVPQGNKTSVIIFSTLAFLILCIASINFMNLSTARATRRAKEVSLRKVVGAKRASLIYQFLGESIILTVVSLFIALTAVELSLPFLSNYLQREIIFLASVQDMLMICGLVLIVGLLGGAYPAFYLSRYKPAEILRSNPSQENSSSLNFRALLVVFQFFISISLFVATFVIYFQMQYTNNKDVGFDPHHLLTFYGNNRDALTENLDIIADRLGRIDGVDTVSWTINFLPGTQTRNPATFDVLGLEGVEQLDMVRRDVGYDFFKTYDIELLAGRAFNRNRSDIEPSVNEILAGNNRPGVVLLNMSAVRRLGYTNPEDVLGQRLRVSIGNQETPNGPQEAFLVVEVIGVTPDINLRNLKQAPEAEFYRLAHEAARYISVRYSGDPNHIVEQARSIWQEEMPENSFTNEYAHEALASQYDNERAQMTMFAAFSGLAIFIACLGLFGLASFTAERRTKEIGIRKVFGAEVWQIVLMLVFQFSKPVLIANIIAWPVAYLAMNRWLESFVYRIDDMVIIALCLVAGLSALLIAWATVAGNSYAVARQNPIKALRYE